MPPSSMPARHEVVFLPPPPTQDPTAVEGSREQRLDAYREVRDQLLDRIRKRFGRESSGNE